MISRSEAQRQKGDELRMRAAGIDPTKVDEQWAGEVMSRRHKKEVKVDEVQEKEKKEAADLAMDKREVVHKRPEGRLKWLHKALVLASKGRVSMPTIYDIVKSSQFTSGMNSKVGLQIKGMVLANLHLFKKEQQKSLQHSRLMSFSEDGSGPKGGSDSEESKRKRKRRRSSYSSDDYSRSRSSSYSRSRRKKKSKKEQEEDSKPKDKAKDKEKVKEKEKDKVKEKDKQEDQKDAKKKAKKDKAKDKSEADVDDEKPKEKQKEKEKTKDEDAGKKKSKKDKLKDPLMSHLFMEQGMRRANFSVIANRVLAKSVSHAVYRKRGICCNTQIRSDGNRVIWFRSRLKLRADLWSSFRASPFPWVPAKQILKPRAIEDSQI
ncbi:Hydin [Symbiodinium pilosum]|uniref:Hydin protein n=1 Tax=Symbiodinium pilosum TaxID=2952 RepID=A0A812TVJ6_SYMPI|nr:Hydin [Symbiodinium pilosum]